MRVQWFARGGGLTRTGPFETQVEAVKAMRLVRKKATLDAKTYEFHTHFEPHPDEFPPDVFVWPEEMT